MAANGNGNGTKKGNGGSQAEKPGMGLTPVCATGPGAATQGQRLPRNAAELCEKAFAHLCGVYDGYVPPRAAVAAAMGTYATAKLVEKAPEIDVVYNQLQAINAAEAQANRIRELESQVAQAHAAEAELARMRGN